MRLKHLELQGFKTFASKTEFGRRIVNGIFILGLVVGLTVPELTEGTIVATLTVGFNVLFTQVAVFTYVTFHLAGPPYDLGLSQLSSLFVVYLVGAVITPFAGGWVDRVGSRATVTASVGLALVGAALTLVPAVWVVVVGLAMCATATFVNQAAAVSFLQRASPPEVRSTASGVYVSCYYIGGSAGGVLPAAAWHLAGWPGCVALIALVQLATVALALRFWRSAAGEPLRRSLTVRTDRAK